MGAEAASTENGFVASQNCRGSLADGNPRKVDTAEGKYPMNRRLTAILGAALGTLCFSSAAMPEELNLPREHVVLVAPPFVHPHEQAIYQSPKIVEFTLTVEGERASGVALPGHTRRCHHCAPDGDMMPWHVVSA